MEVHVLLAAAVLLVEITHGFQVKRRFNGNLNSLIQTNQVSTDSDDLQVEEDNIKLANKGDHGVLECKADESREVFWEHNGNVVDQSDDHNDYSGEEESQTSSGRLLRVGVTMSRLFLDCVTKHNAGVYKCIAVGPAGEREVVKETILLVDTEIGDKIALSSCLDKREHSDHKPARIYMWSQNRLELQGSDIQLFCRASGKHHLNIKWVKVLDLNTNSLMPIHSGERYQLLENGDLIIRNLSWENMGLYRCIAQNDNDMDFKDMFVYPTKM